MKVLAINASPPGDQENTSMILTAFLDGMRDAGAEVELFDTNDMTINPCRGDLSCQIVNPGVCMQNDDMAKLIRSYSATDVLVLASPVCWEGLTGPMKIFLDRLTPVKEPFFEVSDTCFHHPPRYETIRRRRVVLVSGSTRWEHDTFDPVLVHVRAMVTGMSCLSAEYAGALLRPHGCAMKPPFAAEKAVSEILDTAKETGWDLVRVGSISQQKLDRVSREILSQEDYVRIFNRHVQSLREECRHPGLSHKDTVCR
ncbi:flavodoxin family protein [Methanoregula sp.]|uniref:flavodoxin family protein n=1 Tax=Methanoregula sp. TaxID=2052170 RepID=UPI003567846C